MAEPQALRESVLIDGPEETLVGELAYSDTATRGAVLLAGPHPFMGGTMDNNVVQHLAEALASAGYITMRFNYRAIDNEQVAGAMLRFWTTGHAPQDPDLVEDTRAAHAWMQQQLGLPVALLGYSFGAHAVVRAIDERTPCSVLIAPTVQQHDFSPIQTNRRPKLVIYSSDDFATTAMATESWYAQLHVPRQCRCIVGAEHFFKGHEGDVAGEVLAFMDDVLTADPHSQREGVA